MYLADEAVYEEMKPAAYYDSTDPFHEIPQVLELFSSDVKGFWHAHVETGIMRRDNLRIPYVACMQPDLRADTAKSVVVFTGVSECILKYPQVYYELFQAGYNVFSVEHRSQGIADRPLANRQKIAVSHFDEYVQDAQEFVRTVVRKKIPPGSPLAIMGHSMGGMVSLHLGESCHDTACTVLLAPMLGINFKGIPEMFVWLVATLFVFLGFGSYYVLGRHDRCPKTIVNGPTTTDKVTLDRWNKIRHRVTRMICGGIVWNWVKAAIEATWRYQSQDVIDSYPKPILMLRAETDHHVDNNVIDAFVAKKKKGVKKVCVCVCICTLCTCLYIYVCVCVCVL
jgi:lysophospholipase